jgi:hypothetical protein
VRAIIPQTTFQNFAFVIAPIEVKRVPHPCPAFSAGQGGEFDLGVLSLTS